MRLVRLRLKSRFRSLQSGFEIEFRSSDQVESTDFSAFVLAGANGSGKSNTLEALASIFFHLQCMYSVRLPDSFSYDETENPKGYRSEICNPDAFELEYLIPAKPEYLATSEAEPKHAHVLIKKEQGQSPNLAWLNRSDFDQFRDTSAVEIVLNRVDAPNFLPDFVIGYSSGENEILSLPFLKTRLLFFDDYQQVLREDKSYEVPEHIRLVFLDREFSLAVLLVNLLMQTTTRLAPFLNEVGVEGVHGFRLIVRERPRIAENDASQWDKELIQEIDEYETDVSLRLTKNLQAEIDKLKACASAFYSNPDDGTLYLDYLVNGPTYQAFHDHFESPLALFRLFQLLMYLNHLSVAPGVKTAVYASDSLYANETIPTPAAKDRVFRLHEVSLNKKDVGGPIAFKSFSDGEHQLLHAIGSCMLFGEDRSLFLLDEPETHFNPDWRAKFIQALRYTLLENAAYKAPYAKPFSPVDLLITTHSPFLISDSTKENVFVFNKSADDLKVSAKHPDYTTLGASISKITMKSLGRKETLGEYARSKLREFERRMGNDEDPARLLQELHETIGDSVEKTILAAKISKRIR